MENLLLICRLLIPPFLSFNVSSARVGKYTYVAAKEIDNSIESFSELRSKAESVCNATWSEFLETKPKPFTDSFWTSASFKIVRPNKAYIEIRAGLVGLGLCNDIPSNKQCKMSEDWTHRSESHITRAKNLFHSASRMDVAGKGRLNKLWEGLRTCFGKTRFESPQTDRKFNKGKSGNVACFACSS